MLEPRHVFPWLHGLHADNEMQMGFFTGKKKWLRKSPKLLRGITIIKVGGDLSRAKLKGTVAPEEVLNLSESGEQGFLDCDPREGFSVRNFQIQTAKMATLSDIVIYGDESTDPETVQAVAKKTSSIQRKWKSGLLAKGQDPESFHTYILTTPFRDIERDFPDMISIDGSGRPTINSSDFLALERYEMAKMSESSEFSQGVCQGPTPGWWGQGTDAGAGASFDVLIEASDQAHMPDDDDLASQTRRLDTSASVHLGFPSSGSLLPPSWSTSEAEGVLCMCRWIYDVTHPGDTDGASRSSSPSLSEDAEGDIAMTSIARAPMRKVLIHCADGYTESTLLCLAYYMYAEGVPVHTAWLQMHGDRKRNFFAYPSDVAFLTSIQDRILSESPARTHQDKDVSSDMDTAPGWLSRMDGSLPSRILPYLYLGNLTHANNPELLREIGITQILSVGEPVTWGEKERRRWGEDKMMMVTRVQDNGIDPLTGELERCLKFIGE